MPRPHHQLRPALMVVIAALSLALFSSPAAADGQMADPRPTPTNFRLVVDGIDPKLPGVAVRPAAGNHGIELRTEGTTEVVVLGYQGEPYLRVGPDSTHVNVRSPATYLNDDPTGRARPPAEADADAPPVWRLHSRGRVVRWHDHRAHWMSRERPPGVAAEPGRPQTVIDGWSIPLRAGDREVSISGDLLWVPGSPRWPWLTAAAAGAPLALVALRRGGRRAMAACAVLLAAATLADTAGVWATDPAPAIDKAAGLVVPMMAWFLLAGGVSAARFARREATMMVGGAAAGLAWLFGLSDLGWLGASQLPTSLPVPVSRLAVSTTIALGVALMVHAAGFLRLRPAQPRLGRLLLTSGER